MQQIITWVATFNGAHARVYRWDRAAGCLSAVGLNLPQGPHKPEFDDRPVRTYSSASMDRGTGDPQTDPERELEDAYVGHVVDVLTEAAARHAFQRIIIAAPPRAMGAFRSAAPAELVEKVRQEIVHDYVNTAPLALAEILSEQVCP